MSDYVSADEIQRTNYQQFDAEAMHASLAEHDDVASRFISIGGPSAAGKTTLALILQTELPDSSLLSIDSYLIEGLGRLGATISDIPPDPNRPYIGGISPKVWDFDLLKQHIGELKAGRSIEMPVFDQTVKDRIGYTLFQGTDVVILEGGNSFGDELCDLSDYKILATAPLHDRLIRKAVRTHARYKRDDLDDVWGRYLTKDEPSWRFYEAEFRGIADQVFHNPATPLDDYAYVPNARYSQVDGVRHRLVPAAQTGVLHPGESVTVIEEATDQYQVSYALDGRDIFNLPLAKQFVRLLSNHYDIVRQAPGEDRV